MLGINAENFDNEWAIFDRESLGFANQTQSINTIRQQGNVGGEPSGSRTNPMGSMQNVLTQGRLAMQLGMG
jgi:hypothetical protein